ncbi:peptide chain release factor 1 [Candidatus Dependentiae bacterium]|nr:peptide chain release factor 1 [Candidatus Dependentiae bacterium]
MAKLNWELIKNKHKDLLKDLTNSNIDHKKRAELQRKETQYSNLISTHEKIEKLKNEIKDLREQIQQENDEELIILFEEEITENEKSLSELEKELEDFLYPADEQDERSVFLELRSGAGGQEAALFVSDLFKMYSNYALSKGWNISIVDSSQTDIGGYKELIAFIKGKNVYKHLKFESGVHRVQRVPKTEGSGRIHTSTVTVAVLPEAKDVDIQINPQDLRIDTFRASGAGGQHVNTTDSAIRITHIPTGVVVSCQDERSQIKNKAKALKVLQARLLQAEKERKESEISEKRKQQVGMGQRAEKVRTYNYPQNRITDHRINLTLKKLDIIMEGHLDELINPLMVWEKEERKKQESVFLT